MTYSDKKLLFLLLMILCCFRGLDAKIRASASAEKPTESQSRMSLLELQEKVLTALKHDSAEPLRSADLLKIAANWELLSEEFKREYTRLSAIPEGREYFLSPGGFFAIIFSDTGVDSVDILDEYSYGTGNNWNRRVDTPNDVPDYIDEIAFAFDSAYAMEHGEFKFDAPFPNETSTYPEDRYKILVEHLEEGVYGYTYPQASPDPDNPGFSSYIRIRSEWQDSLWNISKSADYFDSPEKAVRITAAHEFFHSIQYSYIHETNKSTVLDDFPISWTEGTAVMMEEAGYPEIDDYVQYANTFFLSPRLNLLPDKQDGLTEYKSGILTVWLYENYEKADLIKMTYDLNRDSARDFNLLFKEASAEFNTSLRSLLSDFFTESWFTGYRSKEGIFLEDSEFFYTWSTNNEFLEKGRNLVREVNPYSMNTFSLRPEKDADSLFLGFRNNNQENTEELEGRIILHNSGGDSILDLSLFPDTLYSINSTVSDNDTLTLVIANSSGENTASVTAGYSYHRDSVNLTDTLAEDTTTEDQISHFLHVYPNPLRIQEHDSLHIEYSGRIDAAALYTREGKLVSSLHGDEIDYGANGSSAISWVPVQESGKRKVLPGPYYLILNKGEDDRIMKKIL
ncbi:MAG: hypothetical protein ACOCSE_06485, partial [Chitinivibrionales bacterium]